MGMKSTQSSSNLPGERTDRTTGLLFATLADTTWRLFVPTVGLTLLGVWLDQRAATRPWLMIVGIIIGTLLAVALVRRQMQATSTGDAPRSQP